MANATTFSGVGSGIDFGVITDAIIAQRSRPIQLLQSRRSDFNSRVEAFQSLNAKLIALTEAARALTDDALGSERLATTTNGSAVAATATSAAAFGSFNVTVDRTATAYSEASASVGSASGAVLTQGSAFELRLNGVKLGDTITVGADDRSLNALRDAINAEGGGKVSASVVDIKGDATEFQLVLTSAETGSVNRVELVETAGADLTMRPLNPPDTSAGYSALDASLWVNGLNLQRPKNSITDVVSGLALELKGAGSASVTVSADTSPLKEKLKAFVEAYNGVQDFFTAQYAPGKTGRPGGVLVGDGTLRAIQQQLRAAINGSSPGNGGSLTNLTEIGLGRDNSGKLVLDEKALDEKLTGSLADVQALLRGKTAGQSGMADSLLSAYSDLSDNISGTVQTAINGYKTSIAGLEKSIANQQDRLEALRLSLQRQFAAVDAAIGQLNGQGESLSNIVKALQPRDN